MTPPVNTDTFNRAALTAEMDTDEGHENFPYTDTKGYLSIARGRNLTGKGVSDAEIEFMFSNDVVDCCSIMDAHIPWWRTLPPSKQRVMINLCFMGWESFSQFYHFLAAMQAENWTTAAAEIENSKWYGQVRDRGPRVVARLLATEVVS
jgi:lysozyme